MIPEPPKDDSLSGGAIAGAVIGFLCLFALFGLAIYIIMWPPAALKKFLDPQSSGASGSQQAGGFDNPLSGTVDSVEVGYVQ